MYRILLLDDEANILSALRRCLGRLREKPGFGELVLECFTSASAALERVEAEDFDLVMSDYRMPEMTGIQFLARVMEVQPNVARILMSAYADRDAVLAAINEVHVASFVCKPWDDAELCRTIAEGLVPHARASAAGEETDPQRWRAMRRLEEECPGITELDRADDGGINLREV